MLKKSITAIIIIVITVVSLTSIGTNMTTLEHQITINAPKAKVFETLADLEQVQHYNPSVQNAKYISNNLIGEGAARECNLGKDGLIQERVIGYKEGQWIKMELYKHNWPLEKMEWTTRVQSDGEATKVSQTMEYQMKFGLLGRLMDKLMMKNKLNSTLTEVFESMKTYIESGAPIK